MRSDVNLLKALFLVVSIGGPWTPPALRKLPATCAHGVPRPRRLTGSPQGAFIDHKIFKINRLRAREWRSTRPKSRFRLSVNSLCVTERKPFDVLAERPFLKNGRGDWHSFEPFPQLIAPIVAVFEGPALPFVGAERLLRLCA